jgi:carbohydrate-selective porin OprB
MDAEFANAADSESVILLKTMLKKGIITQKEYDELFKELKSATTVEKRIDNLEDKAETIAQQQDMLIKKQKDLTTRVDRDMSKVKKSFEDVVDNVSIAGGITTVVQGTMGHEDTFTQSDDNTDALYSIDLEVTAPIGKKGEAYLLFEGGEGDSVNQEVASFYGNNDAESDTENKLEISEAWYEHKWLGDKLIFTIGKVDLTNYFDGSAYANDEHVQFLSAGLVNNIAIQFPDNTFGVRAMYVFNDLIDFSLGYQSGDGDWEDVLEDPFLVAELAFRPKFGKQELQGNYRFIGWINRTEHTNYYRFNNAIKNGNYAVEDIPDFPPDGLSEDNLTGHGYAVSFDQAVNDFVGLFARFGYQDQDAYPYKIAWSTGLNLNGGLWSREGDTFGLAGGVAHLSDDYEKSLKTYGRVLGAPIRKSEIRDYRPIHDNDEVFVEAYYSLAVNDQLFITPDIQHVTNATGIDRNDSTWVLGGRMQVFF